MELFAELPPGHGPGDAPGDAPGYCRRGIIDGLVNQGFAVVPDYFPPALVEALRSEASLREQRGEFRPAAVGRRTARGRNQLVRRDMTRWIESDSLAQCQLFEELEALRLLINRELFMGLFDLEAHFSVYHPGAFYRRHLDAFRGNNPRLVSVVIYLNDEWLPAHGGCLRIWPSPRARRACLEVPPRAGTLVCFLSERIPHEVLPASQVRLSIAGWFRRQDGVLPACVAPL